VSGAAIDAPPWAEPVWYVEACSRAERIGARSTPLPRAARVPRIERDLALLVPDGSRPRRLSGCSAQPPGPPWSRLAIRPVRRAGPPGRHHQRRLAAPLPSRRPHPDGCRGGACRRRGARRPRGGARCPTAVPASRRAAARWERLERAGRDAAGALRPLARRAEEAEEEVARLRRGARGARRAARGGEPRPPRGAAAAARGERGAAQPDGAGAAPRRRADEAASARWGSIHEPRSSPAASVTVEIAGEKPRPALRGAARVHARGGGPRRRDHPRARAGSRSSRTAPPCSRRSHHRRALPRARGAAAAPRRAGHRGERLAALLERAERATERARRTARSSRFLAAYCALRRAAGSRSDRSIRAPHAGPAAGVAERPRPHLCGLVGPRPAGPDRRSRRRSRGGGDLP
jgi:hypothetical protein